MKCTTLLSGSSGNCIFIGGEKTNILIDAGCSAAYLQKALAQMHCSPREISAILITHEHNDHISGAVHISGKFGIPIYASPLTWKNLPFYEDFLPEERHIFEYGMEFGELSLDFFRLSHDACQPVGIVVQENGRKLAIITDTGTITPSMYRKVRGADAIFIEANHSRQMLYQGPYPYFLKKRILGDRGHLSNRQAGVALRRLIGENTKYVVLTHLSQNNNTPETAYREVMDELALLPEIPCRVSVAPRMSPHPLLIL
ncbi:MAG: MBL fold metallo-hydrolase [Firmicutes bacterium]|nr:MBL fold metallo-hydrolase [Bacillota bacterium]